jgi:hypothetical protein
VTSPAGTGVMPEPIGYFQGRPVYDQGGQLVAGSNEPPADAGADGALGDGSTQEDQSTDDTGQGNGGADASGTSGGASEGSPKASSVDASSKDSDGGQQGSGSESGQDDLAGLRKALAAERQLRKDAEKSAATLRKQYASAEERAILEAKEAAAAEAVSKTRGPLVKALAAEALVAAGVNGSTTRLVGLLDLSKVDLDDDGVVVGLADQIEELKTEYPTLFQAASQGGRPTVPNANGGAGSRSGRQDQKPAAPKPWNVILAEQVHGAMDSGGVAAR